MPSLLTLVAIICGLWIGALAISLIAWEYLIRKHARRRMEERRRTMEKFFPNSKDFT